MASVNLLGNDISLQYDFQLWYGKIKKAYSYQEDRTVTVLNDPVLIKNVSFLPVLFAGEDQPTYIKTEAVVMLKCCPHCGKPIE